MPCTNPLRIPLGLHENTRSAIVPLHPILPTSLIMGVKTGQVSEWSGDSLGGTAGRLAGWIMGAEAAKPDTRLGAHPPGKGVKRKELQLVAGLCFFLNTRKVP